MKVVGTGTPLVAQIRFEPCEVETLRAELRDYRVDLLAADVDALHRCHIDPHEDPELETRQARRLAVEELIQVADEIDDDGSVCIEGDFELVRSVVRSGLRRVVQELEDVAAIVGTPRQQPGTGGRVVRQLVEAGDAARAWTQTLADLYYVENHGLTDGLGVGKWHVGL
jgi:hypothetical protein